MTCPPAAAATSGWGSLPVELRAPIIKLACQEAAEDVKEDAACARMAHSGLSLVCHEFYGIASAMQWRHIYLHSEMKAAFFVFELLPKHGSSCRQLTVVQRAVPGRSPQAQGIAEVIADSLELRHRVRASSECCVLRHALATAATNVTHVSLLNPNRLALPWISPFPAQNIIRKLEYRCEVVKDFEALAELLLSIRKTVEELHLESTEDKLQADYGDGSERLFAPVVAEAEGGERLFPELRVLVGSHRLVLPALLHHPVICKATMSKIKILRVVSSEFDLTADMVRRYMPFVDHFIFDGSLFSQELWTRVESRFPSTDRTRGCLTFRRRKTWNLAVS